MKLYEVISDKEEISKGVMVVYTFNPSILESEAGGYLEFEAAWSIEQVPGQPGLQ